MKGEQVFCVQSGLGECRGSRGDSFTPNPSRHQPCPASLRSAVSPELPTDQQSSHPGERMDFYWI